VPLGEAEDWVRDRLAERRLEKFVKVSRMADGRWFRIYQNRTADGGCVGVWMNISALKQREAELAHAMERNEVANRAKTDFLAHMSHELRTPLNAVLGFAEMIREGYAGPLTDRQREYLMCITSAGTHLLDLINGILDLTKIEAGKEELIESAIVLPALVPTILDIVRPQIEAARITMESAIPPDCPLLLADERRIRQMLLNLLSNAIKFTPHGGRVTCTVRCPADGTLTITVRDTGIGMGPGDMARALKPFGQVRNVMSRTQQGTGLGLPLTKSLVEIHGGRLTLASGPNHGTEVCLSFPAARVRPAWATQPEPQQAPHV
jgi:two-component system cell cycle sensor histidine kinase PleC